MRRQQWDLEGDIELLRAEIEQLLADKGALAFQLDHTVANLARNEAEVARLQAELLDEQLGTPCEQIRHKQEIEATIERCAQAVWDAGGDNVEFHCAAVRALKEKP